MENKPTDLKVLKFPVNEHLLEWQLNRALKNMFDADDEQLNIYLEMLIEYTEAFDGSPAYQQIADHLKFCLFCLDKHFSDLEVDNTPLRLIHSDDET